MKGFRSPTLLEPDATIRYEAVAHTYTGTVKSCAWTRVYSNPLMMAGRNAMEMNSESET
jgi:hypothetical protein